MEIEILDWDTWGDELMIEVSAKREDGYEMVATYTHESAWKSAPWKIRHFDWPRPVPLTELRRELVAMLDATKRACFADEEFLGIIEDETKILEEERADG